MALQAPWESVVERGVSRALASLRSRQVADVAYDLSLDLTDQEGLIAGRIGIRCNLRDASTPLVLDFDPEVGSIDSCTVNDRAVTARAWNGHIVIGESALDTSQSGLRPGPVELTITFRASPALHRSSLLAYSLFVPAKAHLAFPCFDQPDLKATFGLDLTIPQGLTALSNAEQADREDLGDRSRVSFERTVPLSTYVFAFAAGRLHCDAQDRDALGLRLFHLESDRARVAGNREAIRALHRSAVEWLETYTGISYPFGKLDVLLVPSFEFSGMEHAGAIFYDAATLLLDESPTEDQLLRRAHLIAHEVAHMWFGNLVTMRWFDDVWLKEVFANLIAGKIVEPSFPDVNHRLRFFAVHFPPAYAVERTGGTHPIRQALGNLLDAKDLYGPIIYHKAPIVMNEIERMLGADAMRDGVRAYLRTHAFGNADWPDLLTALEHASGASLRAWSTTWIEDSGRGLQRLASSDARGDLAAFERVLVAGGHPPYAEWDLDSDARQTLVENIHRLDDPVARAAGWTVLWEEMLNRRLAPAAFVDATIRSLAHERVEQIVQLVLGHLRETFWRFLGPRSRASIAPEIETMLWDASSNAASQSLERTCFGAFRAVATTPAGIARLERVWRQRALTEGGVRLSEADEIALAAELALRAASTGDSILLEQLNRLGEGDRRDRLAFVSAALSPDWEERRQWFDKLADGASRQKEAWVLEGLAYLNHPLRAESAEVVLDPALALLRTIRETGDIFFPRGWAAAVLGGHRSPSAAATVRRFLDRQPADYPAALRRVILQAADNLFRASTVPD